MWKMAGDAQQQQPASGQAIARRWPFVAVLVTVVFIGSSPWLYSQLVPMLIDVQTQEDNFHATPLQMTYNPLGQNFDIAKATEILNCTRRGWAKTVSSKFPKIKEEKQCPLYFQLIHKDLAPWKDTGISRENVEGSRLNAFGRIVILDSKLYIDRHKPCFGNRALFTLWGLLLFLEKYKGKVPDVEFMFNCEDRPRHYRGHLGPGGPKAIFSYNSRGDFFDIPFPDWSFWGWSELMISSWDEERIKIMNGAKQVDWKDKIAKAYWSGNPWVGAPQRNALMRCNGKNKTDILPQDWRKELTAEKQHSKLEDQCNHKYMIYVEGIAWSVSLKYILACGSPTLTVSPAFYDFFSRGLEKGVAYMPVRPRQLVAPELCQVIDNNVNLGEANETWAIEIGKRAQDYMANEVNMENVYGYMYHLLREYAKLQRFTPTIPGEPHLLTLDHIQCLTRPHDTNFLHSAMKTMPSNSVPCRMPDSYLTKPFQGYDWEVKAPFPHN